MDRGYLERIRNKALDQARSVPRNEKKKKEEAKRSNKIFFEGAPPVNGQRLTCSKFINL